MSDATINRFVASGDAAAMAAFTPDPATPASGPPQGYFFYRTDTNEVWTWDAGGAAWILPIPAEAVVGPSSATDNAIARFDGTTGKLIQDSAPIVEDDGRMTTITDPTGLQDAATKNYVDTQIAAVNVGGASQSSFLVSGGQVVWDSAYTFNVSAASYYILGTLYDSAEQSIALNAPDATNDRIDVVAVDDSGTVVKITGTPAAQPSEPSIDPGTQLKLSIVLVAAGSTAPTDAANVVVYADDAGSPTEWNWTASGSGFNVASTNNPRSGTKDIEGTAVTAGSYAEGVIGSGTFDPSTATFLVCYIQSKATWSNKRGLQITLLSNGVLVGSAVNINRTGSFGFNSSQTSSYQQIAIPASQFAVPAGTTITAIRFTDFGGAIGFYLDDISWQVSGGTTVTQGITQEQADARYALLAEPFATVGASSTLPNARRLLAGTNLTFDDTTPGERTLNVSASNTRAIALTVNGGGSALTTGIKADVYVPFACTITAVTLLADQSGSVVVDIWKDTYANYPPTVADSITASAKPTLSTATKSQDTTLTGWTTSISAGDTLRFNVDSASTLTRLQLTLTVTA